MRRGVLGCAAAAVAVLLAGCAGAGTGARAGHDWSRRGPYPVGVTTLDLGSAGSLGERLATVFYPAGATGFTAHPAFRYRIADPLPAALLTFVPARYDSTVTVDARVDPRPSSHGPFPVVLFSHGFGASRLYYSELLSGIASWGFVVTSADYLERGILAEATQAKVTDTPAVDLTTMLSSLDAIERASADPASPLFGAADPHRVAAVGHSSGGETAFDALADPRVRTAVGWAPEGPSGRPSDKPVAIIGALGDIGLTPAALGGEYEAFPGPAAFVEISGEGHNTYTDVCPSIRGGGGGLVGYAISLHLVSGELAKLAVNGCTKRDAPPSSFWPVVQAYTVASLRYGLGIDGVPPSSAVDAGSFPGFTVTVRHHG